MNKYLLSSLLFFTTLWAIDVPIDEVEKRLFSETVSVNSKIVQLSSSKSLVMAEIGGKITKYLVKEGDKVKKGQVVALVSVVAPLELSINITPLKAELKALRNRLTLSSKNYNIVKKLYNKGLESRQNLNSQEEERANIISQIEVVKAKIASLNKNKSSAKNSYKIHAGESGIVEKVLVSPHAVVDANTALLSIIKGEESFLVQSYVPLKYIHEMRIGLKGTFFYAGKSYPMHVSQILPSSDEKTQQMLVLSTIDAPVKNLLVNIYVDTQLSLGASTQYLSVKKTALSFFNNEWVVFVPKHHEDEEHGEHEGHKEEKHDEHKGHGHDEHEEHEGHKEEKSEKHEGHGDDESEEHEGHEEEEVPYEIRVVKIIKQNDEFVAIEGLKEHEDYVSSKSYYVKSLLLKSSLGGHGH